MFSYCDVGYFALSLLGLTAKVDGSLLTATCAVLMLVNAVVLLADCWLAYLTFPVGLLQLALRRRQSTQDQRC